MLRWTTQTFVLFCLWPFHKNTLWISVIVSPHSLLLWAPKLVNKGVSHAKPLIISKTPYKWLLEISVVLAWGQKCNQPLLHRPLYINSCHGLKCNWQSIIKWTPMIRMVLTNLEKVNFCKLCRWWFKASSLTIIAVWQWCQPSASLLEKLFPPKRFPAAH